LQSAAPAELRPEMAFSSSIFRNPKRWDGHRFVLDDIIDILPDKSGT
jgi:hypothetical protein